MGALPKRKPSTWRQGRRRATHSVKLPNISFCSQCKAEKLPHFICPNCGWYEEKKSRPQA